MHQLNKTYKRAYFGYQFSLWVFTLIYWNITIRIAIFLRILGSRNSDISEGLSKGMNFVVEELFLSTIIISLFATFSWLSLNIIYPRITRRLKIRRLVLAVFVFDAAVFLFIGILLGIVHYSVDRALPFNETLSKMSGFLFNSTTLFFLIILFVGGYVYQLLNTLMHQIGYAPLRKIMTGYYQKPREEKHIFMFLDLQSSTTFAEQLGHSRYSDFIQDCFRFLTSSLLATRGRIYQFVGDEVVITWPTKKDKNFKRAVDFYFFFEQKLLSKTSYFEHKYGMIPKFVASINEGSVMAAEVGEVKRELAFHGDVLNTAARIQKQCKRYRKKILVTRNFGQQLQISSEQYKVQFVDSVKFIGKDRTEQIFEIIVPESH